jgi:hypothetical protein
MFQKSKNRKEPMMILKNFLFLLWFFININVKMILRGKFSKIARMQSRAEKCTVTLLGTFCHSLMGTGPHSKKPK